MQDLLRFSRRALLASQSPILLCLRQKQKPKSIPRPKERSPNAKTKTRKPKHTHFIITIRQPSALEYALRSTCPDPNPPSKPPGRLSDAFYCPRWLIIHSLPKNAIQSKFEQSKFSSKYFHFLVDIHFSLCYNNSVGRAYTSYLRNSAPYSKYFTT